MEEEAFQVSERYLKTLNPTAVRVRQVVTEESGETEKEMLQKILDKMETLDKRTTDLETSKERRRNVECYQCGRRGHFANQCQQFQRNGPRQGNAGQSQ